MDQPKEHYWEKRLAALKEALESNNFEVHLAPNEAEANKIVKEQILPASGAKRVSWGGSTTAADAGVIQALKENPALEIVDPFEPNIDPKEALQRRRQAFLSDLFITGTNAVTEAGQLVNLDRTGNRVGAVVFGPKFVTVLAGRNKVVADLEDAMFRVKNYAAPTVAMRINAKTPCVETSYCEECKSPERLCNAWSVVEKSYPKGRIKVVLINQDLGI